MFHYTRGNKLTVIAFVTVISCIGSTCLAENQNWGNYIKHVKEQGIKAGISKSTLDQALDHLTAPSAAVKVQERNQPETTINYDRYIKSRADSKRIEAGKRAYNQEKQVLNNIEKRYGVSSCVVTALWGIETYYGKNTGNFNVIQSLATLGYQSPRKQFYNKELLIALDMVDKQQISLAEFKGAWAGASGQCQFIPSSYQAYAVDYNNDGKKNIWTDRPDALASTANFLKKNGWNKNQPIMVTVKLPKNFNQELVTSKKTLTVKQWLNKGVEIPSNQKINRNLPASLVRPTGGPTLMVFSNYKVIKRWNNSVYFAGAVHQIAQGICSKN